MAKTAVAFLVVLNQEVSYLNQIQALQGAMGIMSRTSAKNTQSWILPSIHLHDELTKVTMESQRNQYGSKDKLPGEC